MEKGKTTQEIFEEKFKDKILVSTDELCEMLSVGRRQAVNIGQLAKAEVTIGRMKRWNVDKIREFLYNEAI